jgi:hypothetical protein
MKQGRVMFLEHCTSSQKSLPLCEVYIKSLLYVSSYIHIPDKSVKDGCLPSANYLLGALLGCLGAASCERCLCLDLYSCFFSYVHNVFFFSLIIHTCYYVPEIRCLSRWCPGDDLCPGKKKSKIIYFEARNFTFLYNFIVMFL